MSIFYPTTYEVQKLNTTDIESVDPSLNGTCSGSTQKEFYLSHQEINTIFFNPYKIDYLNNYYLNNRLHYRILSHPVKTNTCYEKAEIIGNWNPLNVIKALYFQTTDGYLYAVIIPETGCFFNKEILTDILGLNSSMELAKAKCLPTYMTYGTCSPFIEKNDYFENGGSVKKILFDSETLSIKKEESNLDDFSFGNDHRFSLQMNYYECFKILQHQFGSCVTQAELLKLSFKESFVRVKGKLNISYNFSSLNYRTAAFINSIHGFGDVTISNDYSSELELPNILYSIKERTM